MIEDSTLVYEEPQGIRQKLLEIADREKKHAEFLAAKKQRIKNAAKKAQDSKKSKKKSSKAPKRKRSTRGRGGYSPRNKFDENSEEDRRSVERSRRGKARAGRGRGRTGRRGEV